MKYTAVSANEWIYPDIYKYSTGSEKAIINSARNSFACFQVLFTGFKTSGKISFSYKFECENNYEIKAYELLPVVVESNPTIEPEMIGPHHPERIAPFRLFECMKPAGSELSLVKNDDGCVVAGMYFSVKIPADSKTGVISGILTVELGGETINIPYEINIYQAVIPPDSTMKMIVGFNPYDVCEKHRVIHGSPEYLDLETKYLEKLRHMRQNMLYTPWMNFEKDSDGEWIIDFAETERYVEKAMSMGFKYFFVPDVGKRKSWKGPTILVAEGQVEAMSYDGYKFIAKYMLSWKKFLTEKGWLDNFYMGVSDEPNEFNATEFRALCGLMKKFFPEMKLMDASSYGDLHGALDVWVPLNAEYDKHMKEFETFRSYGEEIWFYVCCWPRGDRYINRYMDFPLLATRYLFWGNYKYDLKGYLHWAANFYQPGQDPYICNCPEHINVDSVCILPPGDSHILYPGDGDAYMAVRLEAHRASEEDYELFKIVASKNKALADGLCEKCFKAFNDVEYCVQTFEECRKELLAAASM